MPKNFTMPAVSPAVRAGNAWSRYNLPYLFGALLACLLLALSIQYGNGYYNIASLRLLLMSVFLWIALIPALFLAESARAKEPAAARLSSDLLVLPVVVMVVFELALGLQDQFIYYNQVPFYPTFVTGVTWLVIPLIASYLIPLPYPSLRQWLSKYRFPLLVMLSVLLKVVTVFASYINLIDVGIMMQDSSSALLAGQNPYTTPTAGYGGFNYLPMHLLLSLPFYGLFGDARFGMVMWELIGLAFIYALVKTELSLGLRRLAEVIILLFVWQPRALFVIEQAWGEPLAVGAAAAAFYFFYRQPKGPAADIWLAVLLAVKQYLIYMVLPLFILYNFNWKRYAATALAAILIALPFVIWDPVEFYNRNVFHFFNLPIQTTSLGLTAYFWQQHGLLIPRWISPVAAAVVALGAGAGLKRFGVVGYLHTVILSFFCLFIFGQQAFANYYYLLSFFQVMAIIFFILHHFAGEAMRSAPLYREPV